jgi:HD-like signal output (HDOD) protein
VKIDGVLEFNEYWIGALLHDVGKLVLGFFFWDWVNRVQALRKDRNYSFRQAEAELGDVADHERVGRLLLLNADMGQEIVAAVGTHHDPGENPDNLICLVHLANNLANDLGLGCMPGEEGRYDPRVLARLKISETQLEDLKDTLATEVVTEIKTVVEQCS